MKKLKFLILFIILAITIGIAAVSSNLLINGSTPIASNPADFSVYFSDVEVDGEQDLSLVLSETSLVFNGEFSAVGDKKEITYDVTNASKNYDADIDITCTQSTTYLTITNVFDTDSYLSARSTRTGILTITLSKSYTGSDLTQDISCTISASAVERTTQSTTTIPDAVDGKSPMLISSSENDKSTFRADEYRNKITNIRFENSINVPNSAIDSWDISATQDDSVIGYIVENDEEYLLEFETYNDAYDLVIQSNGELYANTNMSYWFANFPILKTIEGLDNLDSSTVIDASYMFYKTGGEYNGVTIDLSGMDFSNVKNVSYMFSELGTSEIGKYIGGYEKQININLSNVNMENLISTSHMFDGTGLGVYDTLINIEMSGWNIRNVTNMSYMFANIAPIIDCGSNIEFTALSTDKVTDMNHMFSGTNIIEMNLSSFNTSNVTNMSGMFGYAGWCGEGPDCEINLNISSFDTSKVTDMSYMFEGLETPYDKEFTLDLSHFNTSNVTDMSYMFYELGTEWSSTSVDLNLSGSFDISNVTDFSYMFSYISEPTLVTESNNLNMDKAIAVNNMFANSNIGIAINMTSTAVTDYSTMFESTNLDTEEELKIVVNYTSETSNLVDRMLETKSDTSNVVKGSLIE